LIAQISGETPDGVADELRLTEDLHLDSLGRVQLAAAVEERLGIPTESGLLEQVQTLGELRALLAKAADGTRAAGSPALSAVFSSKNRAKDGAPGGQADDKGPEPRMEPAPPRYIYPQWPWLKPVCWLRAAFIEAVMRPLVRLLANPRIVAPETLQGDAPMLVIANHVSAYDGALVQFALPGPIRRRMAAAMSGEMLEDFRHFRNPDHGPKYGRFYPFGPLAYLLITALFNVFPLPRLRDFQPSFAHAGKAMDRGFNVMVFPEGTRSAEGQLARFRPGIGLLARQSGAPVLPVAICGLGELKAGRRRWFRSGTIEVRVGQPLRFSATETEAAITAQLHAEVERLLNG
jgi:long-chain acyl-CoA synthetase